MTQRDSLKVLLVEDSATVAAYVSSVLATEPSIHLLPVATTARAGVRSAIHDLPHVVLMDMKLPDHDGIWAINEIMATSPCPIVVLSGHLSSRERDITFESLRAGAVEVLAKPTGIEPSVRNAFRENLISTIRLMASAVVVRRRRPVAPLSAPPSRLSQESVYVLRTKELAPVEHVLIGASTGGPELLSKILAALSPPLPFSLTITQHTLEGFDESLAQWLSCTGHRVVVAQAGMFAAAGTVLLAPADRHMEITPSGVQLSPMTRRGGIESVDATFSSFAKHLGKHCMGILLTGMGRDGARGMSELHEKGALTIAQAAQTCVVPNMPDSARASGAVRHTMTPDEIIGALHQLTLLRKQEDSSEGALVSSSRAQDETTMAPSRGGR